jgi:hypothetical protein
MATEKARFTREQTVPGWFDYYFQYNSEALLRLKQAVPHTDRLWVSEERCWRIKAHHMLRVDSLLAETLPASTSPHSRWTPKDPPATPTKAPDPSPEIHRLQLRLREVQDQLRDTEDELRVARAHLNRHLRALQIAQQELREAQEEIKRLRLQQRSPSASPNFGPLRLEDIQRLYVPQRNLAAFKRFFSAAVQLYHPDVNPGDPQAEEAMKAFNRLNQRLNP